MKSDRQNILLPSHKFSLAVSSNDILYNLEVMLMVLIMRILLGRREHKYLARVSKLYQWRGISTGTSRQATFLHQRVPIAFALRLRALVQVALNLSSRVHGVRIGFGPRLFEMVQPFFRFS